MIFSEDFTLIIMCDIIGFPSPEVPVALHLQVDLVQALCTLCPSCCEITCMTSLACPVKADFLQMSTTSASDSPFASAFKVFTESCGKGCALDVPFGAVHPTIHYSLKADQCGSLYLSLN